MRLKKVIFREGALFSLFCLMSLSVAIAQGKKYFNPLDVQAIQGRLEVLNNAENYGRLPEHVEKNVRTPVWQLGANSAGLYVDFETNADSIQVRYKVKGALSMPHMPNIGVSGVDLYAFDKKANRWNWAFGQYNFKDTVTYNFNNIGVNSNHTYRLYLPLYNTVEWLEVGIGTHKDIKFVTNTTKPILVYGTSIAQGACATRPGLAWTNMVGRYYKNEIINLAFSGNGRLEKPILDLMIAEDPAAIILDCIPNLAITKTRSETQLDSLITNAVQLIRKKHPVVPIILAEHSSANTPGFQNIHSMEEYGRSSKVTFATYQKLKKAGVKSLYYVSAKNFGLDIESTVDYGHPNDIGMMKIAQAYRAVLDKILK